MFNIFDTQKIFTSKKFKKNLRKFYKKFQICQKFEYEMNFWIMKYDISWKK